MKIPYLAINIAALCCFCLMFVTVSAAKKTAELRVFLVMMFSCILWTGGSVLMRLQIWPGMNVWFYVSLLALLSRGGQFYLFLYTFGRYRDKRRPALWLVLTVALFPFALCGMFLTPPKPVNASNGMIFLYSVSWTILIPCLLYVCILVSTLRLLRRIVREHGLRAPGVLAIVAGGFLLLVGNVAQTCIPGNIFPYDALSGVLFATLLFVALYRKRLFEMTLMVSRSILVTVMSAICIASASYIVPPLEQFLMNTVGLSWRKAAVLSALLLAAGLFAVSALLRRTTDTLFIREFHQDRTVRRFVTTAQTLDSRTVMRELTGSILEEISPERVYICLREDTRFVEKYSSVPTGKAGFVLRNSSPCIDRLRQREGSLVMNEFRNSPAYLEVSQEERELLQGLGIACIAALQDKGGIIALVLLSGKEKGRGYTYADVSFLDTICSIGSIAMKNAGLYEQMYREARIDALTGVLNYSSFTETVVRQFEAHATEGLVLMFVDIDDFKLYNQLYGVEAGDAVLRTASELICQTVGDQGTVFRTSGKVFAALLPRQSARVAEMLAEKIHCALAKFGQSAQRQKTKVLTASIGICAAPENACSAKELMDNADLSTYNAKKNGKDRTLVFRGSGHDLQHMTERTLAIVEPVERGENGYSNAMAMISALTAAIDAKDHYTFAHSKNVALYAAHLAVGAGLNDDQTRNIYAAGLLHDIGKISVPENILNKQGGLNQAEYGIMKDHVNGAIEMMRHLPDMDYLIPAALGHHERWDGKGYPRGIAEHEIPVSARCLAIADGFDAMITDRPYRKGLPVDYALSQIEKGAGTQFDPALAVLFVGLVRAHDIPIRERGVR